MKIQVFEINERCELCGRNGVAMSQHHLIPTTLHSQKLYRKKFSREDLRAVAKVCVECHENIHRFHKMRELGTDLNTLEKLKQDPEIGGWIKWVAKHG